MTNPLIFSNARNTPSRQSKNMLQVVKNKLPYSLRSQRDKARVYYNDTINLLPSMFGCFFLEMWAFNFSLCHSCILAMTFNLSCKEKPDSLQM